jgi:hypothetical protein
VNGFQCHGDIEHASTRGTKDVPCELENPELRRMQESPNGAFLIEAAACREVQHIDAGKLAVGAGFHELLDRLRNVRVGLFA